MIVGILNLPQTHWLMAMVNGSFPLDYSFGFSRREFWDKCCGLL